jgi:uncharacterized protein YqjF (DUF2071 family)
MTAETPTRTFLSAEWRYLAMLNYAVPPDVIRPLAPPGVELDAWNGTTYVSLVGMAFLRTRVMGWQVPFHENFEEVNLRFYVRRQAPEGWRRGVAFVKQIVPKRAIAAVARLLYWENYQALPMRHSITYGAGPEADAGAVEYGWRYQGRWNSLRVETQGEPQPLVPGSEEEFIADRYWGYAAGRGGGCVEYQVVHPAWRVRPAINKCLDCDVEQLYGDQFAPYLRAAPRSAFVAEGSPVTLRRGVRR